MKISRFTVLIIILIASAVVPTRIPAMGAKDNSRAYKTELQQVFFELIEDIYTGKSDELSAKESLASLRNKYGIAYTDEAGILDSIIDRAQEGTLNRDETEFYFELLNSGKLVEYRQENYRRQAEVHQLELLALLQSQLKASAPGASEGEALRTILNNYYDFIGLEYGSEYARLSGLILSLEEGEISSEEMSSALSTISRQAAQNNERQGGRIDAEDRKESGPASAGSDKQQPAAQKPPSPQPAPSPQPGQSQQPSGNGGNPRG